jgi:hypothetical protein
MIKLLSLLIRIAIPFVSPLGATICGGSCLNAITLRTNCGRWSIPLSGVVLVLDVAAEVALVTTGS